MLPLLKYTVLRLALFIACLLLLRLLGANGWLLLLLAAVLSLGLSFLLLRGPREEVAAVLADRVERRHSGERPAGRPLADEAVEDEADERRRSGGA